MWMIAGVVLVVVVVAVLLAFFVVRPRAARQLQDSVQLMANETHGQPPKELLPAKCETISLAHMQELRGVGVISVTDHGVIFAAANPDRTLIIPRDAVISARAAKVSTTPTGEVKHPRDLLVINWNRTDNTQAEAGFTVARIEQVTKVLNN